MNRRHFLMSSAAAAGALSTKGLASANDTVRVACVGIRGQGNSHIHEYSKMQNVEIAALCDVDENVLNKRLGEVVSLRQEEAGGVHRRTQAAGRQIDRCDLDRHAQPLALADRHLGVPGRQGCLLREAVLPQYFARAGSSCARRRNTTASCSMAPTAVRDPPSAKPWQRCARG